MIQTSKTTEEIRQDIIETIRGQVHNVCPLAEVFELNEHVLAISWGEGIYRRQRTLLVCRVGNIKTRFPNPNVADNATWYLPPGISSPLVADGVAIFYGPAAKAGAIERTVRGNQKKDSYRRLAYSCDVTEYLAIRTRDGESRSVYNEVRTRMSERNTAAFLNGGELQR